jgi:hypothetical protein
MTEAELYYTNYEQFEELMINENLKNNIIKLQKEINDDKIILKLFLQQNREQDNLNIETFKKKLHYEILLINYLQSSTRDEKQFNKINEIALNYLDVVAQFNNNLYMNVANDLKHNYEYMIEIRTH